MRQQSAPSARKLNELENAQAQKKPLTPLKASSAEKTSSSKKTPTPEKKEPEADKKALIQKSQDEKEASAVEKEPLLVEVCPIVAKKEQMKKLVHECNLQLAAFRHAIQGMGTAIDNASLRREVETTGRACGKAIDAARMCVLPQSKLKGEESTGEGPAARVRDVPQPQIEWDRSGPDFTRHASNFIGCVAAILVELRRGAALERTFPVPTEPSITEAQIAKVEQTLEMLENQITVHFSTNESTPTDKVTPHRRRGTSCRPQCVCSKLKTSYA